MQQAVRDALIAFMAAPSQAQAEANKEAQAAGIAHAKANVLNYLGRKPSFTRDQLRTVRNMLELEAGTSAIASATGLSRQAVLRIKGAPVAAEEMLARWGAAEASRKQA
jgi:DNA invertase Pin-like site-specific DNA recombinase